MSQIPSRYAASGILIVWSAILFYFWASDRIASYLHPSFHIPVIATAIVLGILAIILVFAPAPESYGCDSRRKGPFAGGPVALAILVIPVLAAVKTSQSSFGATAVLNRGIIQDIGSLAGYQPPMEPLLPGESTVGEGTMMDPSLYLRKDADGRILAETVDLMYAASDETMRSDFDGHQVEVVGQILPARTDNPSGDRFHLVRMFIMCCAADARPAGINIEKTGGTEFPEMSWVKVRGRATFPVENGRHSALVVAESIEETEPPRESFIY
jgi:uncharacterized repeat protein (TIGR03943 family)